MPNIHHIGLPKNNLSDDFNNEIKGNRIQSNIEENEYTSFLLRACHNALIHNDDDLIKKILNLSEEEFCHLDFNRHYCGNNKYNGVSVFLMACALAMIHEKNELLNRIINLPDEIFLRLNFSVSNNDIYNDLPGGSVFLYAIEIALSTTRDSSGDTHLIDKIAKLNINSNQMKITQEWKKKFDDRLSKQLTMKPLNYICSLISLTKNTVTKNYLYDLLANMSTDQFNKFDFSEKTEETLVKIIQSDASEKRQFNLVKKTLSIPNDNDFFNHASNKENIIFLIQTFYKYATPEDQLNLNRCYQKLYHLKTIHDLTKSTCLFMLIKIF